MPIFTLRQTVVTTDTYTRIAETEVEADDLRHAMIKLEGEGTVEEDQVSYDHKRSTTISYEKIAVRPDPEEDDD